MSSTVHTQAILDKKLSVTFTCFIKMNARNLLPRFDWDDGFSDAELLHASQCEDVIDFKDEELLAVSQAFPEPADLGPREKS